MSTRRRTHLQITGMVQGVFFRETARREAARLGLSGWVRNLSDGSVEAVAEGGPDALQAFVTWCHRGPAQARVERVQVQDEPPRGEDGAFRVEHGS